MNNNQHFLEVKDLVVEYTQGKDIIHAVNGVSLTLDKGKTLGLVGETGAGKTTIAKSILRILPDVGAYIRNGEVWLDGQEISAISESEMLRVRGKRVAMIFQDPMTALNPLMTIGDQIVEGLSLHNKEWNHSQCVDEAVRMLEMVGIPGERFVEYPHQFSGGMKQRVVIAMALACNPELLLADEPTTALDVTIQAQVLDLIRDLRKKFNTSMILITHDLGVIAEMCDDVAVIYAGRIVEQGSKWDVFMHPAHPYTKGLFDSLPSMNEECDRLTPIPGMPPDPTQEIIGCPFAARCPYVTDECMAAELETTELESGHFVKCRHALEAPKR